MLTGVSRLSGGILLWGLLEILTSRVPAIDCNQNGVDDLLDMSSGTSPDCNSNFVPDDCELQPVNFGFVATEPRDKPMGAFSSLAFLDLEGDGDLDFAAADVLDDSIYLFANGGNLSFGAPADMPFSLAAGAGPQALDAGDLDSDGDADLALANHDSGDVFVYLNGGAGAFAIAGSRSLPSSPSSLRLADLDGDGDLDIAVVTQSDRVDVHILWNDGTGTFASPLTLAVSSQYPARTCVVAPADVDGDGDADLLVSTGDGKCRLLENLGSGRFAPSRLTAIQASSGIAVADLDGDGDLDVVTDYIAVYLNPGDGAFAGPALSSQQGSEGNVAIADLNADGLLDGAVTFSWGLLVAWNHGGSVFSSPRVSYAEGGSCLLAHDMDSDGAAEVVSGKIEILDPNSTAVYSQDCNSNLVPDECDVESASSSDCNRNGVPDECDLSAGLSQDCNENGVLDTCERDCNRNGVHDDCELAAGTVTDIDGDGVPDECGVHYWLGLEGLPESVGGLAGETGSFGVDLTLEATNYDDLDGAQGWALSIFVEHGSVIDIGFDGIEVSCIYEDTSVEPPVRRDPYEFDLGESDFRLAKKASVPGFPDIQAAVAAVVLSNTEKLVLQPRGRQKVARLGLAGAIPQGVECASLRVYYKDGAVPQGLGPVDNQVSQDFTSHYGQDLELASAAVELCPREFRRGDSNADGKVDISDAIFSLSYLYLGGPTPTCEEAADSNDDAGVDISDPVYLLGCLFLYDGGLGLVAPPGAYHCGPAPGFDGLSCDSYERCP